MARNQRRYFGISGSAIDFIMRFFGLDGRPFLIAPIRTDRADRSELRFRFPKFPRSSGGGRSRGISITMVGNSAMPTSKSKLIRVAAYVRCSTSHQDTGMQVDEITAVAEQRGWTIIKVYEDAGVSGTKVSRPALDSLVADAKAAKFDVVVVWKLDRLARSVVHLCSLAESLKDWGVGLVSVRDAHVDSTTAAGRFTLQILGAVAELERSLIVERVKAGVDRARRQGKHLGRPKVDVDLRPATAMLEQGYGLKAVATALGVPRSTLRRRLADAGVQKSPAAG